MKQRYEPSLEDPLYALDPLQPVAWFAAGDGALEEFDLLAGVTVRRVELGGEPFSGLAIDSAGKTLAVVDRCDGLHRIVAATPEHDCVPVFGQGEWATRVVSLATGKTQLDLQNRGYSSLAPIAGSTRLIARSSAGLEILDGETGRSLGTRIALRSGSSVALSPSGHCVGDRASLEQIQLALPTRSRSLLELASQLLDVKKVRAAWAGVVLRPASLP